MKIRLPGDPKHGSYDGIDPVLIYSGEVLRESDIRRRHTSAGKRVSRDGFKFEFGVTYTGPPIWQRPG